MANESLRAFSLTILFTVIFLFSIPLFGAEQQHMISANEKLSVEDVIPLTMGNLRGHKMLYNEGWYVVTSSSRAFEYAREKSIISSKTALQRVVKDASTHSGQYKESVKTDILDSVKTGQKLVAGGSKLSNEIIDTTHTLALAELDYAGDPFQKSNGGICAG